MEVWILVNNRAGRQHARENGEQVRRVFALGGARARVAYTDTVEEGAAFLQQAAEAQPDLLVCCGGDGKMCIRDRWKILHIQIVRGKRFMPW